MGREKVRIQYSWDLFHVMILKDTIHLLHSVSAHADLESHLEFNELDVIDADAKWSFTSWLHWITRYFSLNKNVVCPDEPAE